MTHSQDANGSHRPKPDAENSCQLLTQALPAWESVSTTRANRFLIGVLPGEGVGPEVIPAAVDVLESVGRHRGIEFEFRYGGPIGYEAGEEGDGLVPEVVRFCESVFADGGAILCGPGGNRFVYRLRSQFDLFCKFTPIQPLSVLSDAGVLRPESVEGVDLVVVRENTGGLYFGRWKSEIDDAGDPSAEHSFRYHQSEVRKILEMAARLAQQRRGSLTLIVKPGGMPAISRLWTQSFERLTQERGLSGEVLEVDNACYQIIASAGQFDVVVAPNLFGDIISDAAALLLGSRGLSYSGNFGSPGVAVYQTGHGAARDIAGQGIANPIGQILSAAMLLRESFNLPAAATAIETAVSRTVGQGIRTFDIAALNSETVGTREMGQEIAAAIELIQADKAVAS